MRSIIQKDDYIGFTYAGIHSSQYGIKSVVNGDRYQRYLSPEFQDVTMNVVGADQTYYFGTNFSKRNFNLNIAFDDMSESEYRGIKKWLNCGINGLVFDEAPYIKYHAKLASVSQISFIPFTDNDDNRIYKGEMTLDFICYDPYGYSINKYSNNYSEYSSSINLAASNKWEWINSSRLLPSKTYNNITYDTPNNKVIYVYNPGDLDSNFKLTFPKVGGEVSIELKNSADSTLKTMTINCNLITNNSITSITIDTVKRLIYSEVNGQIITLNYIITGGDFFKIPVNQELGEFNKISFVTNQSMTDSAISLVYDYMYL